MLDPHKKRTSESHPETRVAIGPECAENESVRGVVSIAEYRKLLGDNVSTGEQITRRLRYLEALCRNVIRQELENYVE